MKTKKLRKIGFKDKIAFGVGSFGQGIVITLITLYFLFYLTEEQGLSATIVGTVFLILRCWDAINDPIMGSIVCRSNFKFGKYRTWILIGSVLTAIITLVMFIDVPFKTMTGKYIYYLGLYLLFGMAYTVVDIPYWSLIPSITMSESDRSQLTSISQIFNNLGTVLVTVLLPILLTAMGNDKRAYGIVAFSISLLYLFALTITTLCIKEKQDVDLEIISYKQIFSSCKKNDQAVAMFLCGLFMSTAFNLTIGLGPYFFEYDIGDSTKLSLFMLIGGVAMVIGLLTYPFFSKKFGRKNIFITSCIVCIMGYSFMFSANMLFHGDVLLLSSVAIFALIGFGWIMVARNLMAIRVCDYSEEKTGYRMDSIWMALNSLSIKLSSAVVPFIIGASFPNGFTSSTSLLILRVIMFILPIALIAVSLLIYVSMFKLDNKKQKLAKEKKIEEKEL